MTELALRPLFDPERLRVYPRMALVFYVLVAAGVVATAKAGIDLFGKPLGYDFITFWSAGYLTLKGHAADAFDVHRIYLAQRVAVPAGDSIFLWHYPPTYQLLVAPLALLPYYVSYLVFTGTTLAAYALTLSRLLRQKEAILLLVAFPGAFICAFHGQNSFLTAALFAGAALTIEKRPGLAGLLLGLLAFKPQLALFVPLALLAAGQWRAFFAAGATAFLFSALATFVFGVDLWIVFLKNATLVREIMQDGFLPWGKMPSAFIFLRLLGLPEWFAYGAQALTALAAGACVVLVWHRRGPTPLAFAVLVAAALIALPYVFDYEFALLAVPLAVLATDMAERGAGRNEKIALVALYALPAVVASVANTTHIQIGFPLLAAALAMSVRRALA